MSEIRFGDTQCAVTSAIVELYHLYFDEPDWSLEVETDGAFPRFVMSGRTHAPALPGPSELGLAYIDQPSVVILDGKHGCLTTGEVPSRLRLVELGEGRVHVEGTLRLQWHSLASDDERDFRIEVALDAALVT